MFCVHGQLISKIAQKQSYTVQHQIMANLLVSVPTTPNPYCGLTCQIHFQVVDQSHIAFLNYE